MKQSVLVIGDILALFLTTVVGFLTHGESDPSFLSRFLAAFLPITITWVILAPWFGLFQPEITSNPTQLWRPILAMIFAAPLAGVFRGLILRADIVPVFIIVFGVTSAFGVVIWRGLYLLLRRKS